MLSELKKHCALIGIGLVFNRKEWFWIVKLSIQISYFSEN